MLNKIISLLVMVCLIATTGQFVFGQTRFYNAEKSQPSNNRLKKQFLDKFDADSRDRAKELLEKDSFAKVKNGSITTKAMQDADKSQQKKKFMGLNTTTAVIIGAAIVATIIIVVAAKGDDDNGRIQCVRAPCP